MKSTDVELIQRILNGESGRLCESGKKISEADPHARMGKNTGFSDR